MLIPPKCVKWKKAQYSTVYPIRYMHVKKQDIQKVIHTTYAHSWIFTYSLRKDIQNLVENSYL